MAASKFTTWEGFHRLGNVLWFHARYDVYADMNDGSVTPYIRLSNCELQTQSNSRKQISDRVAATVKIQINGTGTTYSFSTGSSIQYYETDIINLGSNQMVGYYYVPFSSTTNIPIKKNGEAFTFNVTITMKNGETYTIVQDACGTVSQKINSGPSSINTGSVGTYALMTPLKNDATHMVQAGLSYSLDGNDIYFMTVYGYSSPYMRADFNPENFSSVSFVPELHVNSTSSTGKGRVSIMYFYCPDQTKDFGTGVLIGGRNSDSNGFGPNTDRRTILISAVTKDITVVKRNGADANTAPEFDYFDYGISNGHTSGTYGVHKERFGAGVQNRSTYHVSVKYKTSTSFPTPYPPSYTTSTSKAYHPVRMRYGSYLKDFTVTDTTSGTSRTSTQTFQSYDYICSGSYIIGLMTRVINNANITYRVTDHRGATTTVTDSVTILPYHDPEMPVYRARRCSVTTDTSGDEVYYYNREYFVPDEYGDHALIEWEINISPLNNRNDRTLELNTAPSPNNASNIDLVSYTDSGYMVFKNINPERSVVYYFLLYDYFHYGGYYVLFTFSLNTIYAMMDCRRTGNGLAFGKVSELGNVLDVHRDWSVSMPYDTIIQNYYSNGTSVRLYDWMQTTIRRITALGG